jgi:hypothetical protein
MSAHDNSVSSTLKNDIKGRMRSSALRVLAFALLTLPVAGQTDRQIETTLLEHQHWGYLSVSWSPAWNPIASGEAATLEDRLRANSHDVNTRVRLLNYYWHNQMRQQRAASLFWLIENHPESPVLGLDLAWLFPDDRSPGDHYRAMHDPADYIQARALWDAVIARNSDTPEILHNAARFFEGTDALKSADLAKRLQSIDPEGHGKAVSNFLTKILPGLHH